MLPGCGDPLTVKGQWRKWMSEGWSLCPPPGSATPWQWSSPGQHSDSCPTWQEGRLQEAMHGEFQKKVHNESTLPSKVLNTLSICQYSSDPLVCLPRNCSLFSVSFLTSISFHSVFEHFLPRLQSEGKPAHVSLSFDSKFMLQRCPKFLAKWGLITNKILCVISYLIFLSDYFILKRDYWIKHLTIIYLIKCIQFYKPFLYICYRKSKSNLVLLQDM